MAKLLFQLANVPEQEVEDVCQLLESKEIQFYQTEAGRWKLGVDALWVVDEESYINARQLIDEYQAELHRNIAEKTLSNAYQPLSFTQGLYYGFKQRPLGMIATVLSIAIVLLFVLVPFFSVF